MLESSLQRKWLTKLRKDLLRCWIMKATVTNLAGAPDAIVCYQGKPIAIEFKIRPNKLTAKQIHERNQIIAAGGLYLEIDQFTDYENILKKINRFCI